MYLLAPSFKKAQLQISAPTLLDTTEAHMRLPQPPHPPPIPIQSIEYTIECGEISSK